MVSHVQTHQQHTHTHAHSSVCVNIKLSWRQARKLYHVLLGVITWNHTCMQAVRKAPNVWWASEQTPQQATRATAASQPPAHTS